jgi:hypothetical protein
VHDQKPVGEAKPTKHEQGVHCHVFGAAGRKLRKHKDDFILEGAGTCPSGERIAFRELCFERLLLAKAAEPADAWDCASE